MKINFQSITTKTVLGLTLSSIVFLLFFSFVVKNIFSTAYTQQENDKVTLITTTIAPQIALNLSYGFDEAVNEIARETLKNKNILLLSIENCITQSKQTFTDHTLTLDDYIKNNEMVHDTYLLDPITQEKLAKLTIIYSKATYEAYMHEFTLWFIAGIFFFILAIFLISFFLYSSLKRLIYLDKSLQNFDPNKPERLSLSHKRKDEVSSISNSANIMIENIILFIGKSKELTQELLLNQAHLKKAQRMAKVGSVELDLFTREITLSDEYYRILKLNKNSPFSWKEFLKMIAQEDYRRVKKSILYAMKNGSHFELQYSIVLEDSQKIHILTKGQVRKKKGRHTKMTAISMDITTDVENKITIEKLAYFDALTGLANRTLLRDRMKKAIQIAKRDKHQLAAIFLDLDHFKLINDTLGHSVGDELLIYVANILKLQVRESDTISRLGGDEFVILLPSVKNDHDVEIIANKILLALQKKHDIGTHQLYLTSSIGVSIFPQHGQDCDTLTRNADTAMYEAKHDGRNRFKIYSDTMGNYIDKQLNLEQDLIEAVKSVSQIEVYYQVKIDTNSKEIMGAEALVRWNHPVHGLVFPDDFIYMAESTGLMIELGNIITEQSIKTIQELNVLGYKDLKISINLSARQFQDINLVPFITTTLEKYNISSKQVEFEITESISMSNMSNTLRILNELREIGISIAIDDFGTGHSSLAYLKKFPIDTLKIDKSFVQGIVDDDEDKVIAQTIISMSHSLGMTTVAEGVETLQHADILQKMGCDTLQGYFYSKPISKEAFIQFLNEYKIDN